MQDMSNSVRVPTTSISTAKNFDWDFRAYGNSINAVSFHILITNGSSLGSAEVSFSVSNTADDFDNNVLTTMALSSVASGSDVLQIIGCATQYGRLTIDPAGGTLDAEIYGYIIND